MLRYATAVARWIAAGRPTRSDGEVQWIFETLCRPCDSYDPDKSACRQCGCRLSQSKQALVNKIRMATEHCPLKPPRW